MAAHALMSQAQREEPAVAFEIGPREQVREYTVPARGRHPGHKAEVHVRVINGKRFAFGRFTYNNGLIAIQAIVPGSFVKGQPDIHYWPNRDED
ncbi:hypothetical protein SEA_CAELUM_69 [Streptomyces phage Caelum]|uniref:Uncharacterized protein n=1 Tax=Streptomyces phage Caelum TaxID=2530160 RepID=A0A481VZT7_9CAUD|nr:hypothetical protein KGG86_gp69 [Streptomyces phage Caelum]QBI99429.1 hypothetical protein SEA_CAELUM_69 [Streptomyces phage Caelum]